MEYKNASQYLPDKLLREVQKYISGETLYIPKPTDRKQWGESGARQYYSTRNQEIRQKFREQVSLERLSEEYGLSVETLKKIVYRNGGK